MPAESRLFRDRASRTRSWPTVVCALVSAGGLLTVSACSETASEDAEAVGYPVTVTNCDHEVVFNDSPERVLLLESAPVTTLAELGVLDRVVAKAGYYPSEYYDDELDTELAEIPVLADDLDATGHFSMSQEEVVAQDPDLVLGLPEGINRQTLSDAGMNTLIPRVYCPGYSEDASFEVLYDDVEEFGAVFGEEDRAQTLVEQLRTRVEAATERAENAPSSSALTAAVLYPSVGGGPVYAYGASSMAQPQLEAAGLENVFADQSERVFEVQTEELTARDPDVLILLHQGPEDGVEDSVRNLPGLESVTAVQEDRIITQLFNYTEPASPLVVDGLEMIVDELHG